MKGYRFSKDYNRLFELVQEQDVIVTTPSLLKHYILCRSKKEIFIGNNSKEQFIEKCKKENLEFLDPADTERWCPDRCPVTGRPFFMWIEHPEKGMVPTYGGPFDSYTIPEMFGDLKKTIEHIELQCQIYNHDEDCWQDGTEVLSHRICHDSMLIQVEELVEVIRKMLTYGTLKSQLTARTEAEQLLKKYEVKHD